MAGLSDVFDDLCRQLASAARSEYGPNKYLFAGVFAFIVQADMPYMRGKVMGNADKLEAVARALSLVEYGDVLGEHKEGVLRVVNSVLERHANCLADNVEALNTLMAPEGFDASRSDALSGVLRAAREQLKNMPIVLFDMPPIEA